MKTKRILAALLALVMTATALTGCGGNTSSSGSDEAALFTPGTYTGTAESFGGTLNLEVTVDADKITEIKVLEHKDTPGVSDAAYEKVPAAIVEKNSLAVDTVAGSTVSSKAILAAVEAALAEHCTDLNKLKTAASEEDGASKELLSKSADVVIIGAGGAGMSAAVESLKAGDSVLVLEKMPAAGGNTILAGSAYNAADPERQKNVAMSEGEMDRVEAILALEAKNDTMKGWQDTLRTEWEAYKAAGSTHLFDSPSLHKLQTYIDGDYVGNPALIDILGDGALEGINFLSELGAKWIDGINAAVGATWTRSHTPTTDFGSKGASFVLPQVEYVKANGGELLLEAKATELIMEDGKCVGVKGEMADGQPFEARAAKGVVLATGGFGANVEMRQKYNKHWATLDESVPTTNHVGATGDGIVMAEAAGAALEGMEWIQMLPTYGPGVFTAYIENQIYINKEGNRFVKEDGRRDELSKAVLEQTDAQIFILSDANTIKNGLTVNGVNVDDRVGNGYAWKADTLEDLCAQIGVPYENVKASIEQFNQAVANGNDAFGRTVFDKPFGEGPFYAGLTNPMVHHTMGGVKIDTDTHVLDANGNIIPGLYAAGEVTGGVHGSNRLGGNAIADITVFGRIAGQNVSAGK